MRYVETSVFYAKAPVGLNQNSLLSLDGKMDVAFKCHFDFFIPLESLNKNL
jgi:hypothetical protein